MKVPLRGTAIAPLTWQYRSVFRWKIPRAVLKSLIESMECMQMLRRPILVQPPRLPWLVRLGRQGFAGNKLQGGKFWPKTVALPLSGPRRAPQV